MSFNQNIIDELIKYKRGEFIPNPDEIIDPKIIFGYINVVISRRSLVHILQKEKVGIILINSIEECLYDFDSIFLSDKNQSRNDRRFIIFKRNTSCSKDIAIVIEKKINNKNIHIITAMIADEKYLIKKYKKLR
jgi:hypothetical protein